MGATGMVSATGAGGEGRTPPTNPLLRILYEAQRPLGAVAGIAEEAKFRQEGYDPAPWIDALSSGFKEVKNFDSIVSNPWLAFALNVGADPVTWIPAGWIVKGVKGAAEVVKLDKAIHYARGIEAIDKFDTAVRSKIGGGPLYELRKRNPQAVRDALSQRHIDFDDFIGQFVKDSSEAINKLVQTDEEQYLLHEILRIKPPGKTLADSLGKMSPELIAKYNALSAGGKTAYRYAWDMEHALQAIRSDRRMQSLDAYQTLKERIGQQYKSFSATPNEAIANQVALDGVINRLGVEAKAGDIVEGLTPHRAIAEIVDLIPDIPKAFKGLGTLAVRSKSEKEFLKAARALDPKSADGMLVEIIKRDEALLDLRDLGKQYATLTDAEKAAIGTGGFPEEILSFAIQNRSKSRARKIWQRISRKPIIQELTKAGNKRPNAYPLAADVKKALDRLPLSTDYRDLRDFYRSIMTATTTNQGSLDDVLHSIGKHFPDDLRSPTSLAEIQAMRNELLGMRTPEAIQQSRDVWDSLNKNRFNGFPLNVIRNAPIEKIAKINLDQIEIRMAQALQVEGISTARAVAADNWHRWLFRWLHDKGLLLPVDQFDDIKLRTAYFNRLKEILPPEEFAQRSREGFAKVTSHPIFSGFAVPKTLAAEINSFTRAATNPETTKSFFRFWSQYQGMWKAWQLAIFPSYHSRNAVSNVWNNFLAGVGENPVDIQYYWEAKRLQQKMDFKNFATGKFGDGVSDADKAMIRDLRRGVVGGEYAGELGRTLDKSSPFAHRFSPRNFVADNPILDYGYGLGRKIEDNARIAHYLKMRNGKGLSHLEAVKSVEKYLFDYRRGLTGFEDKYLRGFAAPFFAWSRFNLPLQIEMLAMQPGKFSAVSKLKDAYEHQWGGPDPDTQFQADWFKQAFNVRVRYNQDSGVYEYFFLDQWLPAADISKLMSVPLFRDMIVQLTSPGIKTIPIEILFNYNLFKKRKIEQYEGQQVPIHLPGGKTIHFPAQIDHLLRQMRLVNEVDRFFDKSGGLSDTARWQRLFVGRSYPYDEAKQENWWRWKINTQVRELEGYYARAVENGDDSEAERISKKLDELKQLQDYYK